MTSPSTGRGPEIGNRVDESNLTPAPKAHVPPLQERSDEVSLHVRMRQDGVVLHGLAKVKGQLSPCVIFAIVGVIALAGLAVAVLLCQLAPASGLATFGIGAAIFVVLLTVGLLVSLPRKPPVPPPARPHTRQRRSKKRR